VLEQPGERYLNQKGQICAISKQFVTVTTSEGLKHKSPENIKQFPSVLWVPSNETDSTLSHIGGNFVERVGFGPRVEEQ